MGFIPPEIELNESERRKVKAIARELLEILKKEKLVLDQRKRQQSRAMVKLTIEQVLDEELPKAYTPELYKQKVSDIYQYVHETYYGDGRSLYATL